MKQLLLLLILMSLLAHADPFTLRINTNLIKGTEVKLGIGFDYPSVESVFVSIDWGDGNSHDTEGKSGVVSHTYKNEGEYFIKITGKLERFSKSYSTTNFVTEVVS